MKRYIFGLMVVVSMAWPLSVLSATPMATVEAQVDGVLAILANPALKGEAGREAKRAKIEVAASRLFDFMELSRRSLGLYWNRFKPEEQKEFVNLYRQILEDAYVDKITAYTNEKIKFTKEVSLAENIVEVRSVVETRTGEIPIYYRVMNKDGQWKVYDVVIEGVSLVENYRTQFREILSDNSPEALLKILREKVGKK
jgi:phospholipid transport system substrate-binding protein